MVISCFQGNLTKITGHLRSCELKDVVENLFEQQDYSHLDEQVCHAATGMTLQNP